jgi:hypothetical protein
MAPPSRRIRPAPHQVWREIPRERSATFWNLRSPALKRRISVLDVEQRLEFTAALRYLVISIGTG